MLTCQEELQTHGTAPKTTSKLQRDWLKTSTLVKLRRLPEDSSRLNVLIRKITCHLIAITMRNSLRVKKISRGQQGNQAFASEPLTGKASSRNTRHKRRRLNSIQIFLDSSQLRQSMWQTCLYRKYRSVSVIFQTIQLRVAQIQQRAAIQTNF